MTRGLRDIPHNRRCRECGAGALEIEGIRYQGRAHSLGECPRSPLHDVWLQEQAGREWWEPGQVVVLEGLGVPCELGRRIDPKNPAPFPETRLVRVSAEEVVRVQVWHADTLPCVWVDALWSELFQYLVAMEDFHGPLAKRFVARGVADPEFLQAAVVVTRVTAEEHGPLEGRQRRVLSAMMDLYQSWYRCSSLVGEL